MGGGVSVYDEENVLSTYKKVESTHLDDRYRIALSWTSEVLERERQQCSVQGFEATSPYAQPLMMEKMERSLTCLDEVCLSHCDDQRRSQGHAEVQSLALSGQPQVMIPMGDDSTITWAAADGPIWVYNWREGQIVSHMRDDQAQGLHESAVTRLCAAGDDHRFLASGDTAGGIELWDLTRPRNSVLNVRLHEQGVTGLACENSRNWVLSTSADTYIMIYDLVQEQVLESAAPPSWDCGTGVPNSVLSISQEQPKIMMVGGADGKMRIWSRGDGPMKRLTSISCRGGQAVHCKITSDGYRAVLGTIPPNLKFCDPNQATPGGLLAIDLRCLGGSGDDENRAVVAEWKAGPGNAASAAVPACGSSTGIVDMALIEEEGQTNVLCLVDNAVRAFNLDEGLSFNPLFEHPARASEDSGFHLTTLAACNRYAFVGTSTPSLGVWRRTKPDETHGHKDFIRNEAVPPMLLRATCMPLQLSSLEMTPGAVLSRVEEAWENDRERLEAKLGGKTLQPNPVPVVA